MQRCIQLTGTNRPCGLTIDFSDSVVIRVPDYSVAFFPGGHSERVTPVPIPNTEVKPLSADGTWVETPRESRSPPDFDTADMRSGAASLRIAGGHDQMA